MLKVCVCSPLNADASRAVSHTSSVLRVVTQKERSVVRRTHTPRPDWDELLADIPVIPEPSKHRSHHSFVDPGTASHHVYARMRKSSRTRCLLRLPLHQRLRSTRVHHALCPQAEVHSVRHGITRRATTHACTDCSALCTQRCRDTAEGPHPEGSEVHPEPSCRPGRGAQVSGAATLRWFSGVW